MVAKVKTFSFSGIEVIDVDVQVNIMAGMASFTIVGLADKAIGESRERVRSAIASIGLALPAKRITVNLAPADLNKIGSHFDLPIALGLLIEMGVIPEDVVDNYYCLGELSLNGDITEVSGILPAAIGANARNCGIICSYHNGSEAAWAGDISIISPNNLISLINHFKGYQILSPPKRY
jgi:magnesium chelatase family protein